MNNLHKVKFSSNAKFYTMEVFFMCYYEHYKIARDASWRIILECGITSLPVDLRQVANKMEFIIHKYSKSSLMPLFKEDVIQGDGFIVELADKKHIFLNDKIHNRNRRRFTLGHEIGHGVLNHPLDKIHYRNSEYDNADHPYEFQANIFSRDLLAPACVLKELGVTTVEQIMEVCNISRISADLRLKRLQQLHNRKAFYLSPLEREVLNNFKGFIKENKDRF